MDTAWFNSDKKLPQGYYWSRYRMGSAEVIIFITSFCVVIMNSAKDNIMFKDWNWLDYEYQGPILPKK